MKDQSKRQDGRFKSNGNGSFGGFKKGVQNGPESKSPRAIRRQARSAKNG